jgi:hypothetical protein
MGVFSYFVALLLVVCWAIGLFIFDLGEAVHVLLVAALIVLLLMFVHIKKSV